MNRREIQVEILQLLFEKHGVNDHGNRRKECIDIAGGEDKYNAAILDLADQHLLKTIDTVMLNGSPKRYYPILTEEGFDKIKRLGIDGVL